MYERDTPQEPLKSSSPKLNFLEQSILNDFRWQEAQNLADDQKKAIAKPLYIRLANLLYLVMKKIGSHRHSGKDQR